MTPRLGEGGWFFHFRLFTSVLFFVNWISLFFSISYIVLTCYYCIWLGFNMMSTVLSQRDQSRDMTPRLGVFVILQCTSFRLCIFIPATIITTIGVLRPSWFTEILFWIGLLLSKEFKRLKIIIISGELHLSHSKPLFHEIRQLTIDNLDKYLFALYMYRNDRLINHKT